MNAHVRAVFVLVLTLAGAGAADAQPRERFRDGEGPGRSERGMAAELGLTREQVDALRGMRERQHDMRARFEEVREKREALRDALTGSSASEREIRELAAEVRKLSTDLAETRVENLLRFRKILNPEQRELIRRRIESRRRGFGPPKRPPGAGGLGGPVRRFGGDGPRRGTGRE